MPDELPPLGKFVIQSFDLENLGYPVVVVVRNPTIGGYTLPAIGDACPDSRWSSTHTLTGVTVTSLDQRVLWKYEQLPGVILTEYDQDEQYLSLITTTYQVVANSSISAPTPVQGVVTSFKRIDSTKSLKIVRTIAKPAGYDEQRLMAYPFPSLFDYTVYIFTDACGAFSNIRAGFSTLVQAKVSVTFDNSKQTISGLSLIPKTLQLGRGVQIHEAVLVDAGSYIYSGTCTATVNWPGSSPDYSTYVGTIQGTEQTISGESVLWKAGYYRTTQIKVTML